MRFALPFQRLPPRGRPARVVLALCAWGVTLSLGCFFALDDVVLPAVGGSGGGGGGDAGGAGIGGASPDGGTGGDSIGGAGSASISCDPGTKDCGAGCVAISTDNGSNACTCTPCAQPAHAILSCNTDSGACQLDACEPGYADCDGDTNTYTGVEAGNGCEYSFGPGGELRPVPALLEVPRADIDVSDGGRDDWSGVPAYQLLATCDNCFDDALPDVTAKNEVPSRRDLDAYFRVAWDDDFLYILGDVFDSELFSQGETLNDGRCQGGALCEDALTVFIDGHNDRSVQSSYADDDKRVFLAVGGGDTAELSRKAFRVSGAPIVAGQVDLKATPHGPACYRLEAQFAWSYITSTQNGQTRDGLFPPVEGFEYGFDISVNDWDRSVSEDKPQRESQLFWVSPGDQYQHVTSGFGSMRLVGDVPPPPPPQ
jgi:hypothetical protein